MSIFSVRPNTLKWSSARLFADLNKEKKKMGRPIVGEEPKDQRVQLRLSKSEKKALEQEAKRTGQTMSQVVAKFIKTLK